MKAMGTHELKIWPEFFKLVSEGKKTFELRFNDRDFKVSDTLILKEWDPKFQKYTHRSCRRKITYILDHTGFAEALLREGWVILAMRKFPEKGAK